MLARDPALNAAKEIPDPKLAKAAAAMHDAQERRLTMLKAKEGVAIAKRRELEEKSKAHEEAKLAALKVKQETQARTAKPKTDVKPKPSAPPSATIAAAAAVPSAATTPSLPRPPALRMPAP